MARYVIATCRQVLSIVMPPLEISKSYRDITVLGESNSDRIVIETSQDLEQLKARFGPDYHVELDHRYDME